MDDVTGLIFSALFLASFVVGVRARASHRAKVASMLLLLLAAGLTSWNGVRLPFEQGTADVLFAVIGVCWLGYLARVVPTWLREIRAASA